MDNIAKRLKDFINFLKLTDSQFADEALISRSTLSLFLSGKNKKINDVMLSQIHNAYPQLSISWLLFKEGPMIISEENNEEGKKSVSEEPNPINGDNSENLNIFEKKDHENLIFTYNSTEDSENSREIDINKLISTVKNTVLQDFKLILDNTFAEQRKSSEERQGRLVTHVTVYFDDNTFETFYKFNNPIK